MPQVLYRGVSLKTMKDTLPAIQPDFYGSFIDTTTKVLKNKNTNVIGAGLPAEL